jgi:hypothetical protein
MAQETVISDRFWRYMTNLWCLLSYAVIIYDFMEGGTARTLLAPILVVYVSLLIIFVGAKEFERWYEHHTAKHPGELFVIGWTILIFGLFTAKIFLRPDYIVPDEILSTYIAVLSIMAVTQKSKKMRSVRKKK